MLRTLRIKLTLLYLVSSILLALLVGGAAYWMFSYYFQSSNDEALKAKVGIALENQGFPVPADLETAIRQAGKSSNTLLPNFPGSQINETGEDHSFEIESILADIYIVSLSLEGELLSGFSSSSTFVPVNLEAITTVQETGTDIRTFKNSSGQLIRLFTYLYDDAGSRQVLQAGRFLTAQRVVLAQILKTMALTLGLGSVLLGVASWLLARRTIKPSQEAWDKQLTFIANASHELRAPLTLVHAGVESGLRKSRDPFQRDLLNDALGDLDYMKKLIEDLLLISRMDAHSLSVEIEPVHLIDFLSDLTRKLTRVSGEKDIEIIEKLESLTVKADPVRLKQVCLIVLDNALRNTQPGNIVLVETRRQNGWGTIKITDHGPGIKKENIEKVFDRFFKVDNRSSQEYHGSGLGLSIAKGLIETQKGRINLHSEPGIGTTVTISLPIYNKVE